MSLLSANVYANKTTPVWAPAGSGGGGGGNPTYDSVTFTPQPDTVATSTNIATTALRFVGSAVAVLDASGAPGPLGASSFYAGTEPPRVIVSQSNIDYQTSGGTSVFLATVNSGSNGWDLPNVSSINGVPYVATPATLFTSSNAGGDPVLQSAPYIATSQSFTAPANGKLFIQSIANVDTVPDAPVTGKLFLTVNGSTISNSESWFSATTAGSQRSITSITSFPVTAPTVYDISACVQGTDSTKDGDIELFGSTLFLSFSPQ